MTFFVGKESVINLRRYWVDMTVDNMTTILRKSIPMIEAKSCNKGCDLCSPIQRDTSFRRLASTKGEELYLLCDTRQIQVTPLICVHGLPENILLEVKALVKRKINIMGFDHC
jgi:hypothetical protein